MRDRKNQNKIQSRDEIIHKVLLLGALNVGESYNRETKNKIRLFFLNNRPCRVDFAQFIERIYGWRGVGVLDTRTPFKPHDFHYNNAGLQFRYRDENLIIKLECLKWTDVAKRIEQLIKDGKYMDNPVRKHSEQIR